MNANLRNFALWVIIVLLLLALFTVFQNPDSGRYRRIFRFRNCSMTLIRARCGML